MDTSLVKKHRRRLNFKEGKLDDHRIFYIDIETALTDEEIRGFMERFRQQMARATMVPAEYLGVEIERIND